VKAAGVVVVDAVEPVIDQETGPTVWYARTAWAGAACTHAHAASADAARRVVGRMGKTKLGGIYQKSQGEGERRPRGLALCSNAGLARISGLLGQLGHGTKLAGITPVTTVTGEGPGATEDRSQNLSS